MSDVTKTTVLLQDIADFGAMNEVYAEFSQNHIQHAQLFRCRSSKGRKSRD